MLAETMVDVARLLEDFRAQFQPETSLSQIAQGLIGQNIVIDVRSALA